MLSMKVLTFQKKKFLYKILKKMSDECDLLLTIISSLIT